MEELQRRYMLLLWKICTELKIHLKFIIDLADNGTFAAFEKVVIEFAAENKYSHFLMDFLKGIQHAACCNKASAERPSKSSSKQDELALKFRAEANEAKDEDSVNDVMASLEAFASFNKKQSANAEASSDKIDEKNGEKKSKRGTKSKIRSRSSRHRSRSQDREKRRSHKSRSRTRHRSRDSTEIKKN